MPAACFTIILEANHVLLPVIVKPSVWKENHCAIETALMTTVILLPLLLKILMEVFMPAYNLTDTSGDAIFWENLQKLPRAGLHTGDLKQRQT